jgi:hypothetical protein
MAEFNLTEGDTLTLLAALHYTDVHSTGNTASMRDMEDRLSKFLDTQWPRDKMETSQPQKEP